MKKNIIDKLAYQIIAIKTEQFSYSDNYILTGDEIKIGNQFNFKVDTMHKQFSVTYKCDYYQNVENIIQLEVTCYFTFDINSWESLTNYKKKKIIFSLQLLRQLGAITVGITRGVLHTNIAHTKYGHLFLPLLNIEDMIKDIVEFDNITEPSTSNVQ
ncbi:MAG: hypothetical protein ACOVNU_08485 [Candidatus Kapaibacteriota bacterium]